MTNLRKRFEELDCGDISTPKGWKIWWDEIRPNAEDLWRKLADADMDTNDVFAVVGRMESIVEILEHMEGLIIDYRKVYDLAQSAGKVVEETEKIKPWMVTWLQDPDTEEAWDVVPDKLKTEDRRWTTVDRYITTTLQSILDADKDDDFSPYCPTCGRKMVDDSDGITGGWLCAFNHRAVVIEMEEEDK